MALPSAHIGHQTTERVRIRIPSRKGDGAYFAEVEEVLLKHVATDSLDVNPVTGSVLLKGTQVDVNAICVAGEKNALFQLDLRPRVIEPLTNRITAPLNDLNTAMERFSGGELDLQGMAILTLLGTGLYQLLRGDLRAPPWYVAFWYALGILTMRALEKKE